MSIKYVEVTTLETRGAVDQETPETVEGSLLVGTSSVLQFEYNHSSYGEDITPIYPAFYKGERCWLREDRWCAAFGYSASGTQETIIPFKQGVELFLEHGVFNFPLPVEA